MKRSAYKNTVAFISLIVAVLSVITPPAALAGEKVPLKGTFQTVHHDTFEFDPVLGPTVSEVVNGEGNISHLGKTAAFTDDQFGVLATGILSATYTLTAANGDTLVVWLIGGSELDFPTQTVTFSGAATILGGTGRFSAATGSGTFSGSALFEEPLGLPTNQGPGSFSLDLEVSSPGAAKK